jgi:A/G-specific adenine glycosylase
MPEGQSRVWNNAVMELGGVACGKTPRCDEEECPWREGCHAYRTGDFTAPDVPTQPEFEGGRRQFPGRIIRVLRSLFDVAIELRENETGATECRVVGADGIPKTWRPL